MGNPEPPLDLDDVRELLRLDRAYYYSSDEGVLQETVHRLKLAGKQILKRPSLLLDAIKKFDINALWLPDQKRILIDKEMPILKQRWGEAHEIGHSLIDWHEPLMHGDRHNTLRFSCAEQIEAEANFAAGRLLFLQDRFVEEVHSHDVCFKSIQRLKKTFGNTMTSTMWRVIESLDIPAFGLVSIHPHDKLQDGQNPIRYFLHSQRFKNEFPSIRPIELFHNLRQFCRRGGGPIGTSDLILSDANMTQHVFSVECFHNSYDTLTFGVCRKSHRTVVPSF